jgi:hypothetical protein
MIIKDGKIQESEFYKIEKRIENNKKYTILIYETGMINWTYNNLYHRENGPAATWINNNNKQYWLFGVHYPNVENNIEWMISQIIE